MIFQFLAKSIFLVVIFILEKYVVIFDNLCLNSSYRIAHNAIESDLIIFKIQTDISLISLYYY